MVERVRVPNELNANDRDVREPLPIQPPRAAAFGDIQPPWMIQVAAGMVDGWSCFRKFGLNTAVGATAEDIWDGGAIYVPPTDARIHTLISTDAKDTAADGVGLREVHIHGLGDDGAEQEEVVPLTGLVGVPTRKPWRMIYRLHGTKVGSEGDNAGVITATAAGDASVTAQIAIGNNQTLMAVYQVPFNSTGFLLRRVWSLLKSGGVAKFADMTLLAAATGEGFQVKDRGVLASDGTGTDSQKFEVPMVLSGGSFVKVQGIASAEDQQISAGFDILLQNH